MAMAKTDREGSSVYFTAEDGTRWRVYDEFFDGRLCYRDPPLSTARARVFVPQGSVEWKRLHRFTAGESRDLSDFRLEDQLRTSEYMEKRPFNARSRDPETRS
jgi:hypothetical protein